MSVGDGNDTITIGAANTNYTDATAPRASLTSLDLGGGTNTLTNYGILTLNGGGTYNFDRDNASDSVITNYGTVRLGQASSNQALKSLTISGLNYFNVRANSTVVLGLNGLTSTAPSTAPSYKVRFYATRNGNDAPFININLPSGTISQRTHATQTAFTIWSTGGIERAAPSGTVPTQAEMLQLLASRLQLFSGSQQWNAVFTLSVSGNLLQLAWSQLSIVLEESGFDCSSNYSVNNLVCVADANTSDSDRANGMQMGRLFRQAHLNVASRPFVSGNHLGNLTVTLFDLGGVINNSGDDHGITLDGTLDGSFVSGTMTVNHQTTGTKNNVLVRGANKAALYVKSAVGVTITNGGNLVFAGTPSHNNGLRGIEATSASVGNVSINNSATIGFATDCSSNCGTSHRGILVNHAGSGTVSVSNAGVINLTGSGTAAHGIRVEAGTATGAVTVANTGNINVSGAAVSLTGGASNDTATINFTSGTVTANEIINSDFSGNVTMTMAGGTATGRITTGGGSDTVTVNGGTMTLTNGTSAFGGGTDSLTVNNNGTLIMGNSTSGSDGVMLSGLENFNLNAGSTLQLYLTRNTAAGAGNQLFRAVAIGSGATITLALLDELRVYLPADFSLDSSGHQTLAAPFNLLSGSTASATDAVLRGLNKTVSIFPNDARIKMYNASGRLLRADTITLAVSGGHITMTWSNLNSGANPTTLNCRFVAASSLMLCEGSANDAAERGEGLNMDRFFASITDRDDLSKNAHYNGDLTVELRNMSGVINGVNSAGHGITIDGTMAGSRVTGSVTVNNQTASATKHDVQVRGANKAALYVKSSVGVSINNAASLVFKSGTGNTHNSGLRGIEATSASTGGVTITNSAAIGFTSGCTTNCGNNHRGILVNHGGSGTVSITNSGNINVGSGAAIALTGGEAADTATINFTSGTVTANEIINSDFAGNVTVTINGGSVMGRITLGGGSDTVTIGQSATLTTSSGVMNFGDGRDRLISHGKMILGSRSVAVKDVPFVSLEDWHIRQGATMDIYMNSGNIALANQTVQGITMSDTTVTMELNDDGRLPFTKVYLTDVERFFGGQATRRLSFASTEPFLKAAKAVVITNQAGNTVTDGRLDILKRWVQSIRFITKDGRQYRGRLSGALDESQGLNFALENMNSFDFLLLGDRDGDGISDLKERETHIARSLNRLSESPSLSDSLYDFLESLYTYLEARVTDNGRLEDAEKRLDVYGNDLSSLAGTIYASLVQANWFAEQNFSRVVMKPSCGDVSAFAGQEKRLSWLKKQNGVVMCARSAISSSMLTRSNSEAAIGFTEHTPVGLEAMWDVALRPDLFVSFGGNYSYVNHTNEGGNSDASGHRLTLASSVHLSEYHMTQQRGYRLGMGIAGGYNLYQVQRQVFGDFYESSPSVGFVGVHGAGSYRYGWSADDYIEPSFSASIMQVLLAGTSESLQQKGINGLDLDASLNVQDASHTYASLRGAVDMGMAYGAGAGNNVFLPQVTLGMTYLVTGQEIEVESQLTTASGEAVDVSYQDEGSPIFFDVGVGVTLSLGQEVTGHLNYQGIFGMGGGAAQSHSGTLQLFF